ncbi:MAG: hypothetical protein HZB35_11995 [Nitrospirae bacterium]|nr:hypothetical protein [Nitrospirota bacterium]
MKKASNLDLTVSRAPAKPPSALWRPTDLKLTGMPTLKAHTESGKSATGSSPRKPLRTWRRDPFPF